MKHRCWNIKSLYQIGRAYVLGSAPAVQPIDVIFCAHFYVTYSLFCSCILLFSCWFIFLCRLRPSVRISTNPAKRKSPTQQHTNAIDRMNIVWNVLHCGTCFAHIGWANGDNAFAELIDTLGIDLLNLNNDENMILAPQWKFLIKNTQIMQNKENVIELDFWGNICGKYFMWCFFLLLGFFFFTNYWLISMDFEYA